MTDQNGLEAIIFDFDGVIADTIPLHYASFRQLFAEEGVDFDLDDYRRVASGAPRDRVIRAVLGEDLATEKFAVLMQRKEDLILELVQRDGLTPIPGALELARRFREAGYRLGVASSSRTAALFLEAMGALNLFDAVTDATQSRRSKPHPDVYLDTAEKLEVTPSSCLAIEDARVGVESAHRAGMKVLAITTSTPAADLAAAERVVAAFSEVDPRHPLG